MEAIMSFKKNKKYNQYRNQTKLVRGGLFRSDHGETSEAIFMNSGYVFKSAEEAEARFAGESEGYLYSRYGNPTVKMFEKRMALNIRSGSSLNVSSVLIGVLIIVFLISSRPLNGSIIVP